MNHTIGQQTILRGQHSINQERERQRKWERIAGIVAVGLVMLAVILWLEAT